ncbi:hypothetical protein DFH28DRAFT_1118539 [Melampsora americana]|nr:hypothetical protein DFH28DRAFT_1118539 [Melampsora americana]
MRLSMVLAFFIGNAASGMAVPYSTDGSHSDASGVQARSIPEQASSTHHQARDVIVDHKLSQIKSKRWDAGDMGASFATARGGGGKHGN